MSGGGGSSGWNGGTSPMPSWQGPMSNPGGAFQGAGSRSTVGNMPQGNAPTSQYNSPMNMNQALTSAPGQFSASPGQITTSAGGGQTPLTPGGNTWGGNQSGAPTGMQLPQIGMPNFSALRSIGSGLGK